MLSKGTPLSGKRLFIEPRPGNRGRAAQAREKDRKTAAGATFSARAADWEKRTTAGEIFGAQAEDGERNSRQTADHKHFSAEELNPCFLQALFVCYTARENASER